MEKYEDYDKNGEQVVYIDLKPYFMRIVKGWKSILLWALCGMLLGIIIGFSKPKTFTSTAVVAPEIATRNSLGSNSSLSTLASLAGINANSLAMTDAMHPDLYPMIIASTDFRIGLFDLPVEYTRSGQKVSTDLYDYVANHTRTPWYSYVASLPRICVEAIKSVLAKKDPDTEFANSEGHAGMDTLRLTRQQERVIKTLARSIKAVVEKRTYVLSVQVTMQDRIVAAQVANAVLDHLQRFVVDYRTEKAKENVEYFEKLYQETHDEYMAAQRSYAYYADSHLGSLSRSSQVEQQRLQNEANLKYQMYNTTAQNLLTARARVQQEAPVLVVIQQAKAPNNGKPSKVSLAMLFFFIGACAGALWALAKGERTPAR